MTGIHGLQLWCDDAHAFYWLFNEHEGHETPSDSWMRQSGVSHEMGGVHSSAFEPICYCLGLFIPSTTLYGQGNMTQNQLCTFAAINVKRCCSASHVWLMHDRS